MYRKKLEPINVEQLDKPYFKKMEHKTFPVYGLVVLSNKKGVNGRHLILLIFLFHQRGKSWMRGNIFGVSLRVREQLWATCSMMISSNHLD